MSSQQPGWPRTTTSHLNRQVADFKANLRIIAQGLASHERVDSISVKHVDEAHSSLAKAGLSRTPWYRRTELHVGLGTLLVAIGLAAPTIFSFEKHPTITCAVLIFGLVVGFVLCITGWVRGSLLPPLPANPNRHRWACWPWADCRHAELSREESCRKDT